MGLFYQVCAATPDLAIEELRGLLVDAQALTGAIVDLVHAPLAARSANLLGLELADALGRSMSARGLARDSMPGLAEGCHAITSAWNLSTLPTVPQTEAVRAARAKLEARTQEIAAFRRRYPPPVILEHYEEDTGRSIALWVVGTLASSAFFAVFGYVVAKVRKQLPPLRTKRRRR